MRKISQKRIPCHIKKNIRLISEAKARNYHKVRDYVYGDVEQYSKNDLVQTWAILTAENPMGKPTDDRQNKQLQNQLKNDLHNMHLEYILIEGQYGSPEHSLFLINPTLSEAEKLSAKYRQEAFIFATCKTTKDGENFSDAKYYEVKDADAEKLVYRVAHTSDEIRDQSDAEDFFTRIGNRNRNFKFQIPFFETLNRARNMIYEKYGYQDVYHLAVETRAFLNEHLTSRSRIAKRAELYETRMQRARRYRKLAESLERDEQWELDNAHRMR